MSVIEEISKLSRNGCDDTLLNYICEIYYEIECELNGDEYKEPKKHNRNLCIDCNMEKIVDHQKSTSVCEVCFRSVVYVSTIQYMSHHIVTLCNH